MKVKLNNVGLAPVPPVALQLRSVVAKVEVRLSEVEPPVGVAKVA